MPIALDPDAKIPVSLESDADKAPRPAFLFVPLTCRGLERVKDERKSIEGLSGPESDAACAAFVHRHLRGVEHLPPVNSAEDLLDLLQPAELWELAYSFPARAAGLGDPEKKALPSPSPAGGVPSADPA